MKFYNTIIFMFLAALFVSCEDEIKNPDTYFSIEIADEKKMYSPSDVLSVSLQNKKNVEIASTNYTFDGTEVTGSSFPLAAQKMGKHTIVNRLVLRTNNVLLSL